MVGDGEPATVDGASILDWLPERGLPMRRLADAIGWEIATISRALSGKRPFRISEVPPLARALGVSVQEILPRLGLSSEPQGVTTHWRLAPDGRLDALEDGESSAADFALPPGAIGVRARTAGGPADRLDGWLLVIDRRASGIEPIAIGWLALVEPKDGAPSIRRVIRMIGPATLLTREIGSNEEVAIEAGTVSPVVAMLP